MATKPLTMRLPGGLETQHISHFGADGEGRQNLWILANSAPTVKNLRIVPRPVSLGTQPSLISDKADFAPLPGPSSL